MSAGPKPSLKSPLGQPHPLQLLHRLGWGGQLREHCSHLVCTVEQGCGQEACVPSLALSISQSVHGTISLNFAELWLSHWQNVLLYRWRDPEGLGTKVAP